MIAQDEFIKGVFRFIDDYDRLPYFSEDNIELDFEAVDKNSKAITETRPYRANKYIKKFYGNQKNMTKYLLDNGILTYKKIADVLGLSETIVRNTITKTTKNPDVSNRRKLHIFFNVDFYEKELGKYTNKCTECKKHCKQFYWILSINCPKCESKK